MSASVAAALKPAEHARLQRLHRYEEAANARGFHLIGGIDEVGRGPLAGPVIAACVVLSKPLMLAGLNDSKRVSPIRRVALAEAIRAQAAGWAIGAADVGEIDRHSILGATLLAMERAVAGLALPPDYLLVDALRLPRCAQPQEAIIGGDGLSAAIAAASIVAKVHRDALMLTLDAAYPHYGFARHKGYPTPDHLAALAAHGPCEHHRRSFAPVRRAIEHERGDAS